MKNKNPWVDQALMELKSIDGAMYCCISEGEYTGKLLKQLLPSICYDDFIFTCLVKNLKELQFLDQDMQYRIIKESYEEQLNKLNNALSDKQ